MAVEYMRTQRDVYRYLHDQTLRLANHGLTMNEIAEELDAARGAASDEFSVRGYYGTVNHNVKAVYQRYLGWFDGNPAHLHQLPPTEAGRRYVEFMGGADEVVRRARQSFDAGDYRWVAEVVNHVVFAEPGQHRGAPAAGRHARAARLPGRVRPVARLLPDRRPGAAQRHRRSRVRRTGQRRTSPRR